YLLGKHSARAPVIIGCKGYGIQARFLKMMFRVFSRHGRRSVAEIPNPPVGPGGVRGKRNGGRSAGSGGRRRKTYAGRRNACAHGSGSGYGTSSRGGDGQPNRVGADGGINMGGR